MASLVDIFKRTIASYAFEAFLTKRGMYLEALPGHTAFYQWEVVPKSDTELLVKLYPTPSTQRWYTVTITEKRMP